MTTLLEREIHEQPDALRRLLGAASGTVKTIADAIREFDPAFVVIAARGTSENSARYAQYLLGIEARLPVVLATPSVHTLYGANPKMERALVIGISQSGQSEDVRMVIRDARAQGALTLGITNDPASPLGQEAEHHLYQHAGDEESVAATKTYTTQLAAISMLTHTLTGNADALEQTALLPDWVQDTLAMNEDMAQSVQRYRYMERIAVIGRGLNYTSAYEVALKIKELCSITGEEYSEADFLHGPIAIVGPGFPVLSIAPSGKTLPAMLGLLKKLQERRAECLVISDDQTAKRYGVRAFPLPSGMPEWASPVCAVIPGQLFAFRLAEARGVAVDQPHGLSKVTITR